MYNKTHYDLQNPPPKTVQGYKFNIMCVSHCLPPNLSITSPHSHYLHHCLPLKPRLCTLNACPSGTPISSTKH